MQVRTGETWKDFIRNQLKPFGLMSDQPEAASVESYLEQSTRLRQDFMDRVVTEITALKDDNQARVMMYGHQTMLCYFMNEVFELVSNKETLPLVRRTYEAVIRDLESNLFFIREYYTRYFDFEASIPASLHEECRQMVEQLDRQVPDAWLQAAAELTLYPFIITILKRLLRRPISFGQYAYLINFVESIQALSGISIPTVFGIRLLDYSIQANFNAPEFITYIVSFLEEKLLSFETEEEKIEWVGHTMKQLQQLTAWSENGLLPGLMPVKESIMYWLEQTNYFVTAVQKKEVVVTQELGAKINTSVSVPVLALLTRLFKECGIITNTNLQEVFRLVASNYTSQRRESISAGNFHGKYYTVEENTKRKVTELLLEMLKVVKRMP